MDYIWQTTEGPLYYPKDFQNLWSILFYYGNDFSPVAATELLALSQMKADFDQAGAQIIALGADSLSSHLAFSAALERYRLEDAKALPIPYPLAVADGFLLPSGAPKTILILSPEGEIAASFSYNNDTGANFTEVLRTLLALQTESPTPHGWTPGAHALLPPPETQMERISHMEISEQQGGYCIDWYLCFEGERDDEAPPAALPSSQ